MLRQRFRTCSLPNATRSDNGPPFASTGIHGLNGLNVWWLQIGITHQRITPGTHRKTGPMNACTGPAKLARSGRDYPGHFAVRRVSNAGTFRLHAGQHFLSQALNGEYVRLEEGQDGIWNIIYDDRC